jgi:hypothetical protein
MKRSLALRYAVIMFLLLLSPAILRAQMMNASLSGVVTDPTGAVIPNATAQLTAVGTGAVVTFTTGPDGSYTFPNLLPGIYVLKVTAKGFRDFEQSGIKLTLNEVGHVDVKLELGAAIQTVEVTANASALNFENAVQEGGVTPDTLEHLPLVLSTINRNIASFVVIEPGVGTSGGDNRNGFDARVNGGMAEQDEAILDGICLEEGASSPDGIFVSVADHPISPEVVSEFKIITSNYQPQYGTTTSGILVAVTKSGTSKFDGGLYDFTRNTVLDSRSWAAANRPTDQISEYGGHLAGPIDFPGLRKLTWTGTKKTYFFVNYERFVSRGGAVAEILNLPTAQERIGDFSDWKDTSGNLIPIYDPNTTQPNPAFNSSEPVGPTNLPYLRQQFMGCNGTTPNVICPTDPRMVNSLAGDWLKFMPALTYPNKLLGNYVAPVPVSVTLAREDTLLDVRIDHYWRERDHFAATVHYFGTYHGAEHALPVQIDDDQYRSPNYGFMNRGNYDHTFRPNLINTFNIGWNDFPTYTVNVDEAYVNDFPKISGVSSHLDPPVLTFDNYNQLGGNGYFGQTRPSFVVNDMLSWVKGKHTLRMGGETRAAQLNNAQLPNESGTFYFSNLNTGLLGLTSGNSFASLLLGDVATGSTYLPTVITTYTRQKYYALFLGDTFKPTHKLTVDYGLRWDVSTPTTEKFNHLSFFDPNGENPDAGDLPGRLAFAGTGYGSASYGRRFPEHTYYKGFAPRFGLAFAATNKTVVRAGYAIIFAKLFYPGYLGGVIGGQDGFNETVTFTSTQGGLTPALLLQNGLPTNYTPPPFISSGFDNGSTVSEIRDPDGGRMPYTQQWNLTVEHELTPNLYFDVAYVGNNAHRLLSQIAPVNVLNPSLLSMGEKLYDTFSPGQTSLDGVNAPYPGWAAQMRSCPPYVAQALLPYPQYCGTLQATNENAGNSTYNSFQAKVEKRWGHGFWFVGSYTNEKWIANTLDVQGWTPNGGAVNPYERKRAKHLVTDDIPQTLALSLVYDLPLGAGKRFLNYGGVTNKVFGGWEVSTIFRASSGTPLPITSSNCVVPGQFAAACIPAVLPGANPYAQSGGSFDPSKPYLNKAAFEGQSGFDFTTGSGSPVQNIRQPGYHNEDFTVEKTIKISERVKFQINAQAFNMWNWHCFAASNTWGTGAAFYTDLANPLFGKATGLTSSPRVFQLGARLSF